ncbi:MAG: ADP-ribosyltransferase-containing protein [Bacteroidales bacterium]
MEEKTSDSSLEGTDAPQSTSAGESMTKSVDNKIVAGQRYDKQDISNLRVGDNIIVHKNSENENEFVSNLDGKNVSVLSFVEGYNNDVRSVVVSDEQGNQYELPVISNEADWTFETTDNFRTEPSSTAEPLKEQTGRTDNNEDNNLSEELDENGIPFVKASDGTTTFGEITADKKLHAAPIKVVQGNRNNGLIHLDNKHGKQIKNSGFNSTKEFIEYVTKNYTQIKEGIDSEGLPNGTYLLQIEYGHNNTLYVELSNNGEYWKVNSGGVFRKGYVKGNRTIWSASEVQNRKSVSDNTLRDDTKADNNPSPNGNVSNNSSEGKGTIKSLSDKIKNKEVFNQNAEQTLVDLYSQMPKESAQKFVGGVILKLESQRKKLDKSTSYDDIDKFIANEQAIKEVELQLEYWNTVKDLFSSPQSQTESVQSLKTINAKEQQLGDALSLREFILRRLALGSKFIWENNSNGTRGLGSHLGLSRSAKERRHYFEFLQGSDGRALYPEQYAESLLADVRQQINPNIEFDEVFNEILDCLSSYSRPSEMMDEAVRLHYKAVDEIQQAMYDRQEQEIDRRADEQERERIVNEQLKANALSPDEYDNLMQQTTQEITESDRGDETFNRNIPQDADESEQRITELINNKEWGEEANTKQHKAIDNNGQTELDEVLRDTVVALLGDAIGKKNVITDDEQAQQLIDEANGEEKTQSERTQNIELPRQNNIKKQRIFGGNSGYVGYSMSKRAEQAREGGRLPKTDFKKKYKITSDDVLDVLVSIGVIDNKEWHHTSKFGNRTKFYSWEEESFAEQYQQNKKEINAIVKQDKRENPYKYTYFNKFSDEFNALPYNIIVDKSSKILQDFLNNHPEDKIKYDENQRYNEWERNSETPIERITRIGKEVAKYFEEENNVIKGHKVYHGSPYEFTDFGDVQFFKTGGGEVFGFAVPSKGKIYIDKTKATAETPIHEYTHLWAEALRQNNLKEWKNIVELMKKGKVLWERIKKDYPELKTDDEIADEVLAQYSGKNGAKRLQDEVNKVKVNSKQTIFEKAHVLAAVNNIKKALERFWKGVADFLHIHFTSAQEVADKVLLDLLNGVNPNEHIDKNKVGKKTESSKRYNAEEQAIVDKAKADGTYMKAPNGKDTNLTERQWVQVRTKAFKDWFGDWELGGKVVNIVKGIKEHGFKNFAEARQWAENNIVKTLSNEETNGKGKIRISKNAIDKYLSNSSVAKSANKDVHLSALKVLPQIIKESIIGETHADYIKDKYGERKEGNAINKDVNIHRLYGAVEIDGKMYRTKTTVKEIANREEQKAYNYEITEIELLSGNLSGENISTTRPNNSISVAKILQNVEKSHEKGKKLLDSSKVVDENGEPKVVYHGTDADFIEFQFNKIGSNATSLGYGFYLTSSKDVARGYSKTGNIMSLFLKSKKQLDIDEKPLTEKELTNLINKVIEKEIQTNEIEDYKDSFISNYVDTYSLKKDKAIKEVVRMILESSESAVEQISEISNVVGDKKIVNEAVVQLLGYDTIIKKDFQGDGVAFVALTPSQIKSATDNIGTFDSGNNDIMFHKESGEVKTQKEQYSGLLKGEQKEKAKEKLLNTEPIEVKPNTIQSKDGKSASRRAMDWITKNQPNPITVKTEIGDVVIDKRSVKDSLGHGFGQKKLDAITSLKQAFEENKATYVGSMRYLDIKEQINYYFVYPINYAGERNFVFCRTTKDESTNRLYVHEVFTINDVQGNSLQPSMSDTQSRGTSLYKNILTDILGGKGTTISGADKENAKKNADELKEKEVVFKKIGDNVDSVTERHDIEDEGFVEQLMNAMTLNFDTKDGEYQQVSQRGLKVAQALEGKGPLKAIDKAHDDFAVLRLLEQRVKLAKFKENKHFKETTESPYKALNRATSSAFGIKSSVRDVFIYPAMQQIEKAIGKTIKIGAKEVTLTRKHIAEYQVIKAMADRTAKMIADRYERVSKLLLIPEDTRSKAQQKEIDSALKALGNDFIEKFVEIYKTITNVQVNGRYNSLKNKFKADTTDGISAVEETRLKDAIKLRLASEQFRDKYVYDTSKGIKGLFNGEEDLHKTELYQLFFANNEKGTIFSPQQVIETFENAVGKELRGITQSTAKLIDFINKFSLSTKIIDVEAYNDRQLNGDNWVPLRGWDGEMYSVYGDAQGRQRTNIQAQGRKTIAADPMPYIYSMIDSVVDEGVFTSAKRVLKDYLIYNKEYLQKAGETITYMYRFYPNENFRKIISNGKSNRVFIEDGDSGFILTDKKPKSNWIDEEKGSVLANSHEITNDEGDKYNITETGKVEVVAVNSDFEKVNSGVILKVFGDNKRYDRAYNESLQPYIWNFRDADGTVFRIALLDKNLVQVLNSYQIRFNKAFANPQLRDMAMRIKNFQSKMVTSWSINFALKNFIKDFINANWSEVSNADNYTKHYWEELKNLPKVAEFIFAPRFMSAKALRGEMGHKTKALYLDWIEWQSQGGMSGMASFFNKDVEGILKRMKFEFGKTKMSQVEKVIGLKATRELAELGENFIRFACYRALLKSGLNKNEASYQSKEISPNYSRTGRVSQKMNLVYLFYSATMNATYHPMRMFINNPKAWFSQHAFYLALGIGATLLAYAVGKDDDEEDTKFVSPYKKLRFFYIPRGRGYYIPLPHEAALPFQMGTDIVRILTGQATGNEFLFDITQAMPEYLPEPYNSQIKDLFKYDRLNDEFKFNLFTKDYGNRTVSDLAPSQIKPFVDDLLLNEDYLGNGIIYDNWGGQDKTRAGLSKPYDNTYIVFECLAQAMNEASNISTLWGKDRQEYLDLVGSDNGKAVNDKGEIKKLKTLAPEDYQYLGEQYAPYLTKLIGRLGDITNVGIKYGWGDNAGYKGRTGDGLSLEQTKERTLQNLNIKHPVKDEPYITRTYSTINKEVQRLNDKFSGLKYKDLPEAQQKALDKNKEYQTYLSAQEVQKEVRAEARQIEEDIKTLKKDEKKNKEEIRKLQHKKNHLWDECIEKNDLKALKLLPK